ncbi:MAG: LysR family transcriptional regulator [Erysipelotrichaceae bacterium]|nr:LysR family transcriptional regulator [Erysipelotrichaceae bacterium]
MTIDDIRKIITVVDTGSMNKAAEKLYIAQPALSRCVQKVEEEYGITLFDRTQGKKIRLTEEGEMFYQAAKEIMLVNESLVLQIERHKKKSTNRILLGVAPQQAVNLTGEMMRWFYLNAPEFQIETMTASSRQLHQSVLYGEIDAALINVSEFYDELHYEKETKMNTCFYIAKGSALSKKAFKRDDQKNPMLRVEDLNGERFAVNKKGSASRAQFDRLVETYGLNVRIIEEENMYQRLKLSDDGIGTYVLVMDGDSEKTSWWTADESRRAILDPAQDQERWRYLVCRKGFEETEKFKALLKCLRKD